jgi:hypothetical protein
MYCKNCGNLVQDGDAFCRKCGNPITVERESKICPKCGNELQDEYVYCNICGYKIKDIEFNQNTPHNENAMEQKPKSKKNLVIAGCVSALTIVILARIGKNYISKDIDINDDNVSSNDIIEVSTQIETSENDIVEVEKKLVKGTEYGIHGGISYEYDYEYDSQGNLIREIHYDVTNDQYGGNLEYEYDSQGNLIKDINYYNDNHSVKEYDSMGNEIKFIVYNEDGSIAGEREYELEYVYDSKGNLAKCYEVSSKDNKYLIYEYEYDNLGNMIKKEFANNGALLYEYEYDSYGNMTKEIDYKRDGSGDVSSEDTYEYEYDVNGNMIKEISKHITYKSDGSTWGEHEYKYEYEYDAQGNLIKVKRYDEIGYGGIWKEFVYE